MSRLVVGLCFAGLISASPAWAQTASDSDLRGRLFVHFEGQVMTAKDSFDAVTGSSMLKGLGGGLEVQNVWRGLFVRAAVSRLTASGERVFVLNDVVFPLGIPLDVTMTPIEAAIGWRFKPIGSRGIVPYAGGGALFLKYREESKGDGSSDGVNETYNGFAIFGGVEVPVWKSVTAGAEAGWRKASVKNPGGAMEAFGENDLGGVTFRIMVSFRK